MEEKQENSFATDSVYHLRWYRSSLLECPHPAVREVYGTQNNMCLVPAFKCLQCSCAIKFPYFGGVKCSYKKEGA